jgi:kynurenine formamidase
LVDRGVKTVMIDTPALDSARHMPYGDGTLESHQVLFEQNIPGVEGLGGELNAVTGLRCMFSCAPVNYVGGEAFPLRVLAVPLR